MESAGPENNEPTATTKSDDVPLLHTEEDPSGRPYRGKSRLACGGRCISGPDKAMMFVTFSMIALPMGVFCGIVCPALLDLSLGIGITALVISGYLCFLSVGSLFWCGNVDPGVVPRAAHPPPEVGNTEAAAALNTVLVRGVPVKSKYCPTCKAFRPPRVVHCKDCDNCVERFDHHCPWVANCIGKRNYKYFVTFTVSTTLLCASVMSFSAYVVAKLFTNMALSNYTFWSAVALVAYCGICALCVGSLGCFHLRLLSTDLTTNESLKMEGGTIDASTYPFGDGCLVNWGRICCIFSSRTFPYYSAARSQLDAPV